MISTVGTFTKYSFNEGDIWSNNKCTCCGNDNLTKISEVRSKSESEAEAVFLATSICGVCGNIQRTIAPSEKWLLEKFQERDEWQRKEGFNPINEETERHRERRYLEIGNEIYSIFHLLTGKEPQSIVDIGCGTGNGLKSYHKAGFNPIGIDPDQSRTRIGIEQGLDIKVMTWQKFFESDSNRHILDRCNFFSSVQSLEHFYNPEALLNAIFANAHQSHALYLEVPNAQSIDNWKDSLYAGHLNNFCENSILLMLKRVGYNICFRINPYKEFQSNLQNLCILAFADEGSIGFGSASDLVVMELWSKDKVKDYCSEMIEKYSVSRTREDDALSGKACFETFNVPMVNDLMFTYKPDVRDIKSRVIENSSSQTLLKSQKLHHYKLV